MTLSSWEHFGPWNGVGASLYLDLPTGTLQSGLSPHHFLPENQCVLPYQGRGFAR